MTTPPPRPAREWPIPSMDHAAGWKDTAFTWAMGKLILQRIADGETMKAITADPRMPAYCTVFRWMQVVPEFGTAVRQVRAELAAVRRDARDARRAAVAATKRPWKAGPPSSYSEARARAVLGRIEKGASMTEVVAEPGMPSFKVVYTWLRDRPAFREAYIEACDRRERLLGLWVEAADHASEAAAPGSVARAQAMLARRGYLTPKVYRSTRPPWRRLRWAGR